MAGIETTEVETIRVVRRIAIQELSVPRKEYLCIQVTVLRPVLAPTENSSTRRARPVIHELARNISDNLLRVGTEEPTAEFHLKGNAAPRAAVLAAVCSEP